MNNNCLIDELKKLKESSKEAVENITNFSEFKKYMHVKRNVQDELFNIIDNMLGLLLLMLAGFIYYVVRAYLENDAMLKAKHVAKEYMKKSNLLTNKEIEEIIAGYDDINTIGVKMYLYRLLLEVLVRTLIFSVICIF